MRGFSNSGERSLHIGPVVSVAEVTVTGPGGESFQREVVRHPGAVVMVPLDGEEILMVRQYRAAVGTELLELPAGKRDVPGEPPEETARRELEEEVGMRPGRLERLAEFYNSPGFCDEHSILFLAGDLRPGRNSPQGVEEAHLSVVRVDLAEARLLVRSGEIIDAKTILGLCLAGEALR